MLLDPLRRSSSGWAGVTVRHASSKSASSSRYLARQKKDSFVRTRSEHSYVSRSAFKLAQLDDSFRFLRRAGTVIDLGASPGGWTQVALERMGKTGSVFALDLLELDERVKMTGADSSLAFIRGDFTSSAVQQELHDAVLQSSASTIDVILSDMMANTSGNSIRDTQASMDVIQAAFDFANRLLTKNGWLIIKYFDSPEAQSFRKDVLHTHFEKIQAKKVAASRKESSEMYWICHGRKEI